MCKSCNKMRQRDWVNSSAPSRQKAEDIALEPEQQLKIYTDVINRMKEFGIMSESYAEKALQRVIDTVLDEI